MRKIMAPFIYPKVIAYWKNNEKSYLSTTSISNPELQHEKRDNLPYHRCCYCNEPIDMDYYIKRVPEPQDIKEALGLDPLAPLCFCKRCSDGLDHKVRDILKIDSKTRRSKN